MSKCCETCARWIVDEDVDTHGWCNFVGENFLATDGCDCRAYLERGRKTVRVRLGVFRPTWGDVRAVGWPDASDSELWEDWRDDYDSRREGILLAYAEVDVPLPPEPPTVEGVCS